MDGTLVDSESLSTKSTEFAFQEVLGRKLTGDENSRLIGRPVEKVLKNWFPDNGNEIYRVGAERFDKMVDEVAPFPGVRDMLQLTAEHYRMALVTSSQRKYAEKMLSLTGMRGYFEFIVAQEDTAYQKPDPEPVLLAIRRMGLSSNQCVFVGDQPYDITAGREAGLITVGAVWGSGDMETLSYYHPDKIIHDPHLLIEFLESVSGKKQ